jgi:predicted NAD-dependent protein-ADP-ribosyltransferase YbiA (DUF1768 family)
MKPEDFRLDIVELTEEPDEFGNHKMTVDLNTSAVKFLTSYGLRHLLIASAKAVLENNEMYESDIFGDPSSEGC